MKPRAGGDVAEIVACLNAYAGNDVWQDVIYDLLTEEEWEAAPDSSDRFTRQGVEYRFERGEWVTR